MHDADIHFTFVMEGRLTLNAEGQSSCDLQPGDALEWECEIENQQSVTLRFANEVYTGEMCIMIGDNVGPSVSCQHF